MIEHILKGGIHPNGHKISDISSIKDFQVIEGDEFFIPFVQHIGSPASAVVKIGDEVERGQLLAECGAGLSSRIHSPVNGQVIDISQVYHPAIGQVSGCTIKAINNDTSNFKKLDGGSDLSDLARRAGIVGLGGAGFPAYIKLNPNKPIDTVIINGAECEPYLMCDHALMHAKYESILAGAQMIKEHVKAGACIIAVENNKKIVDKYFDVIIKPLVTEKTMKLTQQENKITVVVAKNASKNEIKDAFEAIFGVKVAKVNTVRVNPKAKRMGRYEGQVPGYKKAIVKLAEGQSLDLYKEAAQ